VDPQMKKTASSGDFPEVAPYELFSACYDRMMRHVDYAAWADFAARQFAALGIAGGRRVDLACGTGAFLSRFARYGVVAEGIDASEAMLERARARARTEGLEIAFSRQDMRHFTVSRPADALVCLHDSFNYLLADGELVQTLTRIREALRPGGAALFDLSTRSNIRDNFAGRTFCEDTPGYAYFGKTATIPCRLAVVERSLLSRVAKRGGKARAGIHTAGLRRAVRSVPGLVLRAEYGGMEEVAVIAARSVSLPGPRIILEAHTITTLMLFFFGTGYIMIWQAQQYAYVGQVHSEHRACRRGNERYLFALYGGG
jgi:SAM-dependent methyltransferase